MAASTARKLIVEVIDARDLNPKDGQGTSSPYVVVDFHGQRKRTPTAARSLNPKWNKQLEFKVADDPSVVYGNELEVVVCHDRTLGPTRRSTFLGRVQVDPRHFVRKGEEAVMQYPLESKKWFAWVKGEIGLKIYYVDDEHVPPPKPPSPPATDAAAADTSAPPSPPETEEPSQPSETKPSPSDGASPPPSQAELPPPSEPNSLDPPPQPTDPSPPQEPKTSTSASPPPEKGTEAKKSPESDSKVPAETIPHASIPPPQPEMMAASVSTTIPDVRTADLRHGQPVPLRRRPTGDFSMQSPERCPVERCSFDLVDKMHYLFVRVVKARSLPVAGTCLPVVKIAASGCHVATNPARRGASACFEWGQTFAFSHNAPDSPSILEVSVWDGSGTVSDDVASDHFLGGICFDTTEIPLRDPPDSPLAPQWYRLEGGGAYDGDLMLATWTGTQADESFPDAWKTDAAGNGSSRAKVYLSPKLWYLRVTVMEAQDILPLLPANEPSSIHVKCQLGFQVMKTKQAIGTGGYPTWNEDLMFVASEPLHDHLGFILEHRRPKGTVAVGVARVPLSTIERRVDDRQVAPRWVSLGDPIDDKRSVYRGRVHLRMCFDGGYHVMDEAVNLCSDYQPTARQLWKPAIGTVELGVIGCRNLPPVKTVDGKGSTDAYAVAKYGPKWVRTRTASDSLEPRWNEQYTWKVYDPCTVLTVGVFDSDGCNDDTRPDFRIGKVRIRISTLEMGRVYRNTYPLRLLSPNGLLKMGEMELSIRFSRSTTTLDVLHTYSQPLLPLMHHIKPLGMAQQEKLRNSAAKIVAAHLSRSEPPLRREVVLYLLDADSHGFSMRKVRANWYRIISVVSGAVDVVRWVEDTRAWRKRTSTLLVHALLVMLVWFPELIVPTLAFYVFAVGAWHYRFRPRAPPSDICPRISLSEVLERDELDEEFDTVPSSRPSDVAMARYDKLRVVGARVQTLLGDCAAQAERVQALVTWRDPRATGIFVSLCLLVAVVLYLVPSKMVSMAAGFYYLRHPMFRDRLPSPALNFFRRLPSLSDRVM